LDVGVVVASAVATQEHEVQLFLVVLLGVLVDDPSPVLCPVKLLMPNDAIPKCCLTGRYGTPSPWISSIASNRVTE
jgi:hypothetical protein